MANNNNDGGGHCDGCSEVWRKKEPMRLVRRVVVVPEVDEVEWMGRS